MDKPRTPETQSPTGWRRRDLLRAAGQAAGAGLLGGSAIALMACEKKPPAQRAERSVHLLQWSHFIPDADPEFRRQAEEFSTQSGVKVTVETVNANDLPARSTAAVESGRGPDIIQSQWNQTHLYASGLLNVDALAEEIGEQHGGYYPSAVAAGKVGGEWKSVPYNVIGNAIVYRKDKFAELGISEFPQTWDGLMETGTRLKEAGMPIGQSLGHTFGDAPTWCYPLMWAFGGQEVESDGKTVVINTPATVEAVRWMTEFYPRACDPGGLSWDDTANNRAFFAQTISATLNGASIYFVAKQKPDQYPGLAEKMAHALLPEGPAGRFHVPLDFQHGIMKYTEEPEACQDLIRFIMAPENYEKWFTINNGYSLGPGEIWGDHAMWESDPAITIFRDMAQYGRTFGYAGPYNRLASEVQAKYIIVDLFARAVQGTDTPEEAVAWAERELRNVYGRA